MNQEIITIEKLVHGGQGMGTLADGRRVFVWNALPGEQVEITLTKNKRRMAEAVVSKVVKASSERVEPRDAAYLSTSPWQIMTFEAENNHKQTILNETMQREHVAYEPEIKLLAGTDPWHYRNKMEYSFWADEAGLHLALFNRGTHQKQPLTGSSIAMPQIDEAANKLVDALEANSVRGSQLKSVVIRTNQQGEVVIALFVKDQSFPEIKDLMTVCKGLVIYYSEPKSPASVKTRRLHRYGDVRLSDSVRGMQINYDVNSFFQVNLPLFETALESMAAGLDGGKIVDMYSGVGTIGVVLGADTLVEIDADNIKKAHDNVSEQEIEVVHASAEGALEYILPGQTILVDPPRAGLHHKVTTALLETVPEKIVYLSCNPITQARDLALLQEKYDIVSLQGFNFFPRTPHIESLAILKARA